MVQRITEQMVQDTIKRLNSQMSYNISNSNNRYFTMNTHNNEIYLDLLEEKNNEYVSLIWAQKRFKTKKEEKCLKQMIIGKKSLLSTM